MSTPQHNRATPGATPAKKRSTAAAMTGDRASGVGLARVRACGRTDQLRISTTAQPRRNAPGRLGDGRRRTRPRPSEQRRGGRQRGRETRGERRARSRRHEPGGQAQPVTATAEPPRRLRAVCLREWRWRQRHATPAGDTATGRAFGPDAARESGRAGPRTDPPPTRTDRLHRPATIARGVVGSTEHPTHKPEPRPDRRSSEGSTTGHRPVSRIDLRTADAPHRAQG